MKKIFDYWNSPNYLYLTLKNTCGGWVSESLFKTVQQNLFFVDYQMFSYFFLLALPSFAQLVTIQICFGNTLLLKMCFACYWKRSLILLSLFINKKKFIYSFICLYLLLLRNNNHISERQYFPSSYYHYQIQVLLIIFSIYLSYLWHVLNKYYHYNNRIILVVVITIITIVIIITVLLLPQNFHDHYRYCYSNNSININKSLSILSSCGNFF